MNKVSVSFDLSLKGDESISRIFGWILDAMERNLCKGESITNIVVEQSEDDAPNEEMDSIELEEQQRMMRKFSPPSDEDGC